MYELFLIVAATAGAFGTAGGAGALAVWFIDSDFEKHDEDYDDE